MELCNAEMLLTKPAESFKIRLEPLSLQQQSSDIFSTDGSDERGEERMEPFNGSIRKHAGGHLDKIAICFVL